MQCVVRAPLAALIAFLLVLLVCLYAASSIRARRSCQDELEEPDKRRAETRHYIALQPCAGDASRRGRHIAVETPQERG